MGEVSASILFNTPLETGLRSLVILEKLAPNTSDLQRLVYFDYLVVHSADIDGGPASLHAPVPHRSGEIIVRRNLVERGLNLMISRELAKRHFLNSGIAYGITELTSPFLSHFQSQYFENLRTRASWLSNKFQNTSDDQLKSFVDGNLDKWGAEFSKQKNPGDLL